MMQCPFLWIDLSGNTKQSKSMNIQKMKPNTLLLILLIISHLTFAQNKDWQIIPFVKPPENPILQADSNYIFNCPMRNEPVRWQKADVFNPAAIVRNGKIYLLFRAEDIPGTKIGFRTSRIGLAVSEDGLHFNKRRNPVLYPTKDKFSKYDNPGGCEDPRIVESPTGGYIVTYTSWNRDIARLSVASSKDLIHWKKHGPIFEKPLNGKYLNTWSKSGSIVTQLRKGKIVAAKIKGKYWMYWGEKGVNLATSPDLIHWTPVTNKQGELIYAMQTRPKKYDSDLTEPGPPALLTKDGIVLFYNGKNAKGENSDTTLLADTYSGGQALFDKNDPTKLLDRMDNCFIKPDRPHEMRGQYASGTTFIESLVYFKKKWFLYYGTADSMVGVAIKE
jgi:beta-1,2-mannosidase